MGDGRVAMIVDVQALSRPADGAPVEMPVQMTAQNVEL
jgi:hypothetical protein